jgi:hypothetical protein
MIIELTIYCQVEYLLVRIQNSGLFRSNFQFVNNEIPVTRAVRR